MATGTTISITVEYEAAQAALEAFGVEIDPLRLLHAIGLRGIAWMSENLDVAGIDHPHQQMSENTIAANPQRSSDRHFSSRYRSRLKQSFTHEVSGDSVSYGTADEFAAYHQYGTRPYTIRPIHARALRFMTANGIVFSKEVHHPGIPARPLLPEDNTARDMAVDTIDSIVERATQDTGLKP